MYKLYCAVRYTAVLYEDVIFISLVDFYFTPLITTKHNNNDGTRHETVSWVDQTIIDGTIFPLVRLGR